MATIKSCRKKPDYLKFKTQTDDMKGTHNLSRHLTGKRRGVCEREKERERERVRPQSENPLVSSSSSQQSGVVFHLPRLGSSGSGSGNG